MVEVGRVGTLPPTNLETTRIVTGARNSSVGSCVTFCKFVHGRARTKSFLLKSALGNRVGEGLGWFSLTHGIRNKLWKDDFAFVF